MLGGGGGGGTEANNSISVSDYGGSAAAHPRPRRSSLFVQVPGRRRSLNAPTALQPYESTSARGQLIKKPGITALMKDHELGKNLPLLNMILPLYNEQSTGAVTASKQDTHTKLRYLADIIAALLIHHLGASKKGAVTAADGDMKDAAVSSTPVSGNRVESTGSTLRMTGTGEAVETSNVQEGRGCGAAIALDNTQWLDHNSWELMHLLRKALPGMLIFAAFRPFSEMNLKHSIAVKTVPGTLKMNMGRLTATQVMLLLSNSFGVQRTNEELLEFLEVTAKGNPRDVIHMMEDLLKERIVEVDLGHAFILKELSENVLKIKDHTSAPVIAKYDQLTRRTKQLVQVAAVIGQEVPLDLLVDVHFLLAPSREVTHPVSSSTESTFLSDDVSISDGGGVTGKRGFGGGSREGERDDVDAQINTLVRIGLLERSSLESVRFVAKYMVTVIYDMILHSKRQEMHKEVILWYLAHKSFVDLKPHFRFLGKHAMAAGDQDLAVKFLVMAAEVAISCGDPTEAQVACAAVTQAVGDSDASGHLTFLDQSEGSTTSGDEALDLSNVERYGPCGLMLKKCGNDAKMLLGRLNKYQEATRSFHRDLLTDNKKIIQAHNQMFVSSGGVLSVSHRTDPSVLPWYLGGTTTR